MDGILILEQYIIFIRIVSFLRTFENTGLKLTLPLALSILLVTVILMLLYLYCGVITYLDFAICFIF